MKLLVAEPDAALSRSLAVACGDLAQTTVCRDFHCARGQLVQTSPDLLVTNLRLADYNGLHLILLAKAANRATRCVVHSDRPDMYLIREAQAAGAFFERTERLTHAVTRYIRGLLPDIDRRDPERFDRRVVFRGGRRAADQPVLV
jgi:response regulator of citrate/malate metabolism